MTKANLPDRLQLQKTQTLGRTATSHTTTHHTTGTRTRTPGRLPDAVTDRLESARADPPPKTPSVHIIAMGDANITTSDWRQVQVGRVVLFSRGTYAGRLATIVEIIDHKRVRHHPPPGAT